MTVFFIYFLSALIGFGMWFKGMLAIDMGRDSRAYYVLRRVGAVATLVGFAGIIYLRFTAV